MNDNQKPAPVGRVSEEELADLHRALQYTDYTIVRRDRVRTLSVGQLDTQSTLRHLTTKEAEDAHVRFLFADLAMNVMEELLQSGAMRKHISPLISADGSRRYTLELDVFMPDGSGFPMEPR